MGRQTALEAIYIHCLKKTTLTQHIITSTHINRFLYFFLQRCCWVSMLPPLASVSALPGEAWTHKFGLFSHAVYRK